MLQVHVVTPANKALYPEQMDLFFRWRHRIYVDEKHWMPPRPDQRELDQFDTDDATYLLAFQGDAFVAGSRLRPFSRATMLGEVFPHLVGVRGMPSRATDAEWTRMFVVPSARDRNRRSVAGAMCCAVMEYCLDAGIARLGGIQETYWLPRWTDFGWRIELLGLPQDVDGTFCVAAMFDVSPEALDTACRVVGVEQAQLVHYGPRRDFVTGAVHPRLIPETQARAAIGRLPKVLS
jgi:acyl-homoserine lactone synthase